VQNTLDPSRRLFSELMSKCKAEINVSPDADYDTVGAWAQGAKILLDRGQFSFRRHEYLEGPYGDNHRRQVEMKCTQMGNTVRALLRAFHMALFMPVVGVMYLFPSRTGSGDFVRSRVNPIVESNPNALGAYLRDTDSVSLKRVKGRNMIFRGTKSREGLRSDPVDAVFFDEFDLFPEGVAGAAQGRLAHSEMKIEHYLSNPTLPDHGIDVLFQLTDQRYWLLKCPKCNEYTCLEDTFPDCLAERGGKVVRLCQSCRDGVLDPAVGQWVAKRPSITDWRGYHYSQLFSVFEDMGEFLNAYQALGKSADKEAFYNFRLGLPYVEAENRLDVEHVLSLCGDAGIPSSDRGPCYMGVDQGLGLHVTIGKMHPDRIVYIGVLKDWEELDRLMQDFRVVSCVVDAQPERRNAKGFADRFPGKVWLNFYSETQKSGYAWNDDSRYVTSNRTESMDEAYAMLAMQRVALPKRSQVTEEFAAHCHAVARKLDERDDGSRRYVYVKLKGADHYMHSWNYACIARQRIAGSFMGGCDLS
jgi:hypothetical protein